MLARDLLRLWRTAMPGHEHGERARWLRGSPQTRGHRPRSRRPIA